MRFYALLCMLQTIPKNECLKHNWLTKIKKINVVFNNNIHFAKGFLINTAYLQKCDLTFGVQVNSLLPINSCGNIRDHPFKTSAFFRGRRGQKSWKICWRLKLMVPMMSWDFWKLKLFYWSKISKYIRICKRRQ